MTILRELYEATIMAAFVIGTPLAAILIARWWRNR